MTAQKVGSYTYATTGRLNGGWNEEVGYGLLDVSSAIQMACQDTLLLSNQNIVSDITITHCQVEIENVSVSNNAKKDIDSTSNNQNLNDMKMINLLLTMSVFMIG